MPYTIEQAVTAAENCARAKRIAGSWASVPYSEAQLVEIIEKLLEQFAALKAEATLANRRYAASNARYNKLAHKTGKYVAEEEEAE